MTGTATEWAQLQEQAAEFLALPDLPAADALRTRSASVRSVPDVDPPVVPESPADATVELIEPEAFLQETGGQEASTPFAPREYEPLLTKPLADIADPWFGGYERTGDPDALRYGEAPPPAPDIPPPRPYVPLLQQLPGPQLRYNHVHGKGGRFGSSKGLPSGSAATGGSGGSGASGHGGGGSGGGHVRPALSGATTHKEVSDAIAAEAKRITGRDIYVNMAGSDLQIAREHGEAVLQGMERFPNARVRAVDTYEGKSDFQGAYDDAFAVTFHSPYGLGSRISFNRNPVGNAEEYRRQLEVSGRTRHLKVSTPHGVAYHEFGHVVAEHGLSATAAKKISSASAASHGMKPSAFIRQQISHYAASNAHELAAEAFADVMANGDGAAPISQQIFNLMAEKSGAKG